MHEHHSDRLQLQQDVSPADWIVASIGDFGADVGSYVPASFTRYAKIFHPAYLMVMTAEEAGQDELPVAYRTPDGIGYRYRKEIRWAEVAVANGRVAHRLMDWPAVTGSWRYLYESATQPAIWDRAPCVGSLPARQSRQLVSILRQHTTTPEACWFALWDGWGDVNYRAPRVHMPARTMWLFSGDIDAWVAQQETAVGDRSPNLWWPEDRAWCVATDIDLNTTIIGGAQSCIDAIIEAEELEAAAANVGDTAVPNHDTINPEPANTPN